MKVTVNLEKDGKKEEREFDLRFNGREQKSYLKKIGEIAKTLDKENTEGALEESIIFIDFQIAILSKKTNLSIEELEEMDLEERGKLTKAMRELLLPSATGFF
jgi:hypothetical protein